VYYSGRVQGVGFRYTVRSLSTRFSVTGFVRNLPDGRVEVAVEGDPKEVRSFLDAIRAELGHYITDTGEQTDRPTARYRSFDIRF